MKIVSQFNYKSLRVLTLGLSALISTVVGAACQSNLGPSATPTSAFSINPDGTVVHSTTGLMWKRCIEGYSGADCSVSTGGTTGFSWSAALEAARDSTFAGYSDWRLPNKQEFESLIDDTCRPAINSSVFPGSLGQTWTSTSGDARFKWYVEFSVGATSVWVTDGGYQARLVRGGQVFDTADLTSPATTITAFPPASFGSIPGTASISFIGTDNKAVASYECAIDGGANPAWAVCSSPFSLESGVEGAHTFQVRAKDTAGNVDATPASYTWLSTAPPSVNPDTDNDSIPDLLEAGLGCVVGVKDNAIFAGQHADSNMWFVMQQYRDFLSREAEITGRVFWTSSLSDGTYSRERIIQNFFKSPEFQGSTPSIVRLYLGFFRRIPDHAGLQGWASANRTGRSIASIADSFARSSESQLTYGTLSNEQFVTLVYQNVLGRTPDAPGYAGWLARLSSGDSRGEVMAGFTESPEFRLQTQTNVFVIMMYEGMLRRAAEQAGYDFWVSYINGGKNTLDLTSGFLNSTEYRERFFP